MSLFHRFAKKNPGLIAGQVVGIVLLHFCEVFGLAFLLGSTVSALETKEWTRMVYSFVGLVAVLVAVLALYGVQGYLESRIVPRFTSFAREHVYDRYVHHRAGALDTQRGYILAEASKIPWYTVYAYKCGVSTFLPMVLVVLFFILFVFCIDPVSGGLVLAFFMVYAVVVVVLFRRIFALSRERYHQEAATLSWLEDVLSNSEYVFQNNATSLEKNLLREKQESLDEALRQEIVAINTTSTVLMSMLVVLALGLFFFCFWRFRRSSITLSAFTFVISGIIVVLIDTLTVRFTRQVLEQIDDIGPSFFSKRAAGVVHGGRKTDGLVDGVIEIDGLSFGKVFRDLRLTVPARSAVLIKGAIGSGKSTLLRVLDGSLRATNGTVRIDGMGIDVFCPAYLKTRVMRMTQKTELFRRPFLDNLLYPDRPGSRGWKAKLRRLERYAFLRDFVQKNKTTKDATRLSGGQKQLTMLVRVLLNDPCVLLLDEPTASADAESRRIIRELLKEFIHKRTVLCISHDKDMDDLFDRVVVLTKDGIS
ncbi:ABC transporter ATP-binding protein [bacterium]|nr:ABC transporter ATP-binding protein [bacterium]